MLAPEDRRRTGLVAADERRSATCRWPACGAISAADCCAGFSIARPKTASPPTMIELMRIKTASDRKSVRYLSGGNQQKVVLGKWLCLEPKLLLLDEPTRGIDVGAKEEIYKLMDQLAGQGVAILFASSEMEEIIGLSDRALVMHEGRIAGELSRARAERGGRHAAGNGRRRVDRRKAIRRA